jgi:proton-translocating NADH-quinone oxidoreductase chain N
LTIPFLGFYLKGPLVRPTATLLALGTSLASVTWLLWGTARIYVPGFNDLNHVLFGLFEVTPFSLYFKFVFLGVASLVALVSSDYLRSDREPSEYYALLLIATFGMMIVASARDLITLFVGFETAALSSYGLVAFRKMSLAGTESATKFFIIGSLSAGFTLYGISLVYAVGGTVNIYELATILQEPTIQPALLLAIGFLIAGFGFEASVVPFHMWAPDVYQGAPDTVSAFLAAGNKKMGFAALIKVFLVGLVAVKFQWDLLVGILAIVTMTVGNLAALQQTSLKRMLAWSSIAQAGYILVALPVGTTYALAGGLFHILTHAAMKGGAFVLVALMAVRGIGDALDNWRGVGRKYPLVGFTLAIIMLSMAGIPPLAGFWSKFIVFSSAVDVGLQDGRSWLIWLAVAGILNSAISLYYYARVIRTLYVDDQEAAKPVAVAKISPGGVFAATSIVFALIFFGLWPEPLIRFATSAAEALLGSVTP